MLMIVNMLRETEFRRDAWQVLEENRSRGHPCEPDRGQRTPLCRSQSTALLGPADTARTDRIAKDLPALAGLNPQQPARQKSY